MDKKKESPLTIRFKDFYTDVNVHERESQNAWEFDERYSTMRDLHKSLTQQFKGELPDFPTKKWFGNTDKNFLSQRKATLQTYFTNILNHLDIQKYPILMNFFYRKGTKSDNNDQSMKQQQTKTQDKNKNQQDENGANGQTAPNKQKKDDLNANGKNLNKEKEMLSEQQKQTKRNEVFTQTMMKINEKIQNKFITNLTDNYGQVDDPQVHEQKRAQINQTKFNLKSQLISGYSLPQKNVEKCDLKLNENINHVKISSEMDTLAIKLEECFKQIQKNQSKNSDEIIVGKYTSRIE